MTKKKKILLFLIIAVLLIIGSTITIIAVNKHNEKVEREKILQQIKEYYDTKVEQFILENEKYDEVDITFLGDSLTDGYDLNKYYPEFVTLNRGIGGDTTTGLLNRIAVSTSVKSKVIVMLIGVNNIDSMMNDYEQLLIYLNNLQGTKIVLLSLTSMGKEWARNNEKAKARNVEIKALAQKYNFTFVDLFTLLLNPETNKIYDEYTTDGGHFTSLGYEVITNKIKPIISELITE